LEAANIAYYLAPNIKVRIVSAPFSVSQKPRGTPTKSPYLAAAEAVIDPA
jgi:hypothetical protein